MLTLVLSLALALVLSLALALELPLALSLKLSLQLSLQAKEVVSTMSSHVFSPERQVREPPIYPKWPLPNLRFFTENYCARMLYSLDAIMLSSVSRIRFSPFPTIRCSACQTKTDSSPGLFAGGVSTAHALTRQPRKTGEKGGAKIVSEWI